MRRLKYLVSVRGGMTPDRGNLEYWDGSIPWITAKDMKVLTVIDSEDRISDSALLETGLKTIEPPAVLLVVRGMILAHTLPVAEVGGRLTVNQDMKALIPRLTVDCGYLAWLLRGLSRHLLALVDDAAHGTKALRSESLFNTFLPVPPMDEQRAIASYLAERTEALDRCVSAARAAIDRLTEYRSALIAAAVTGQIDVREAA